ncbi:unnamed protein product [Urochloa humidicola]
MEAVSQVVSGGLAGSMRDGDDAPARAGAPRPTPARNGPNVGNIEVVWNHGTKLSGQGFKCGYCGCTNRGGGATRLRDHLGCIVGEVKSCPSVPRAVRDAMRALRQKVMEGKREKEQQKLRLERDLMRWAHHEDGVIDLASDQEDEARMEIRKKLRDKHFSRAVERRGENGKPIRVSIGNNSVTTFFDKDLARSKAPVQPRIDTALLEGSEDELGLAWAKWFHANDVAGFKADCPYFQNAIRLTQKLGTTARLPTSRGIDGKYLQANFDEAEQSLEIFKKGWNQYGVTIMCDSWTGPTGMSIINFMVYSNGRMFFHKSIDASGHKQSAEFIYQQIKKVVAEEIGPKLVVQIVTDNGSNYKKASDWWFQFGGEVPTLQKYALRIVSQCVSSSGCERNWSTFALVHTKIRNKLSYDKLHKLVYVHYNLKERIQEKTVHQQKEVDPCAMMLDAALFDETNPIWDWLDKSMSGVGPSLDDLYPSRLDKPARGRKGKRVRVEEEEEIEFLDSETGDEEEYEDPLSDDESARVNSGECSGDELGDTSPLIEENIEAPTGRSRSGRPLKKKRIHSLY